MKYSLSTSSSSISHRSWKHLCGV